MTVPARNAVQCLVIGGGLAGGIAALRLAEAGRRVLLLEKEREPHDKVCGEFLSGEACGYLGSAGIDPMALGAERIENLRVSTGKTIAETKLPFPALSLSRRVLDEALLARAEEAGAVIRRGAAVELLHRDHVHRDHGPWCAELADGEVLAAESVFLATGKHELRGWRREHSVLAIQEDLVGFKLHWRLHPLQTAALRGWMELFLFPGGYGGLALVEGGAANLCLVVQQRQLRRLGGWPALLARLTQQDILLRRRLGGAEPVWNKPMAISSIPYGYLAVPENGLWRLGDQAAVIPSFTGDGMSIALHSGALAARKFLSGAQAEDFQRELAASLRGGMRLASVVSRATVHPLARWLAPALLRTWPGGMRALARRTRIPQGALIAG